ncbi:hypothetical protein M885DRAFT_505077 [Pelagophyceae sp. CCMP2097]|nr:hypothetical protein M885DRAFT_505077 [Pelagophyceae sp. CCMP2097]|mmetsp:Transcript_3134/g.11329  ORF Transcript_3134/g.11329 Transcript_3134/m.11329 type:complete len:218 (+) Transcript_3134:71-724(+)
MDDVESPVPRRRGFSRKSFCFDDLSDARVADVRANDSGASSPAHVSPTARQRRFTANDALDSKTRAAVAAHGGTLGSITEEAGPVRAASEGSLKAAAACPFGSNCRVDDGRFDVRIKSKRCFGDEDESAPGPALKRINSGEYLNLFSGMEKDTCDAVDAGWASEEHSGNPYPAEAKESNEQKDSDDSDDERKQYMPLPLGRSTPRRESKAAAGEAKS